MAENKIVLPGEQVSTSEELLPGDGTFEEDGIIRASRVGNYFVDEKHDILPSPITCFVPTKIEVRFLLSHFLNLFLYKSEIVMLHIY